MTSLELEQVTDGLIAAAYTAAIGSGSWSDFVAACGAAFPWSKTAFCLFDRENEHCSAYAAANYDPEFIESWDAHYSFINPWIEMSRGNDWDLRWSFEALSVNELKKTEFYAGWIQPQDNICTGFAVNMRNETGGTFMITNTFREKDEAAASDQFEIMRRIRPHLLRAYELQKGVAAQRAVADSLATALNAVRHAVFLLEPNFRIKHANHAAELLMAEGKLLDTDTSRVLRMRDSANEDAIKGLARRLRRPVDVVDPPYYVLNSSETGRYLSILAPEYFGSDKEHFFQVHSRVSGYILVILDLKREILEPVTALQHIFHLTPSESRLATAFANGVDLRSYAQTEGIQYETARTKLKSILQKTDTSRQADLMRILVRIVDFEDLSTPN